MGLVTKAMVENFFQDEDIVIRKECDIALNRANVNIVISRHWVSSRLLEMKTFDKVVVSFLDGIIYEIHFIGINQTPFYPVSSKADSDSIKDYIQTYLTLRLEDKTEVPEDAVNVSEKNNMETSIEIVNKTDTRR